MYPGEAPATDWPGPGRASGSAGGRMRPLRMVSRSATGADGITGFHITGWRGNAERKRSPARMRRRPSAPHTRAETRLISRLASTLNRLKSCNLQRCASQRERGPEAQCLRKIKSCRCLVASRVYRGFADCLLTGNQKSGRETDGK